MMRPLALAALYLSSCGGVTTGSGGSADSGPATEAATDATHDSADHRAPAPEAGDAGGRSGVVLGKVNDSPCATSESIMCGGDHFLLAADDSFVYFEHDFPYSSAGACSGGGCYHVHIGRIPVGGGPEQNVWTTDGKHPHAPVAIALAGDYVFFTDSASLDVERVVVDGSGAPVVVAQEPAAQVSAGESPWGLAVDSENVYFTTLSTKSTGSVLRAPLGGGVALPLVSGKGSQPTAIAVDNAHVYFGDDATGSLSSVPLGGGTVTTLDHVAGGLFWSAGAQGGDVYWLADTTTANAKGAGSGTSLCRTPSGGGATTTLATGAAGSKFGLMIDGYDSMGLDATGIYLGLQDTTLLGVSTGATVVKVPLAGGAPKTLATAQRVIALAIDTKYVFWIDDTTSDILRADK